LVADKRVSTPTDAGKFLSKSWKEGEKYIKETEKNIYVATKRMIVNTERRFNEYKNNFKRKIKRTIREKERDLNYLFTGLTDKLKTKIEKFYSLEKELRSQRYKIRTKINVEEKEISSLNSDLKTKKERWEKSLNDKLNEEKNKLNLSSPVLKLKQGYSITKIDGKLIKSKEQVENGDLIETKLSRGVIKSKVEDKK
jgi:exodeoxyribonuclease VII large subunit